MSVPLPVSDFLAKIEESGLSVAVDGDDLLLRGPKEARTQTVRAYLQSHKLKIVEHLTAKPRREAAKPPVESAVEFEDAAPEVMEAVRQVYVAAQAGLLPVERVSLGPGHSCADPNAYVVRCLERIQAARRSLPVFGWATYLDNLHMERQGVVAVALWWASRLREGAKCGL